VRRAFVALAGTAAGTVLLIGAKAGYGQSTPQKPVAEDQPAPQQTQSQPQSQPQSKQAPPKSGSAAPPARPATGFKDGTFNGNAVETEFGKVQVAVVVAGGKITDVKHLQVPNIEARSLDINKTALPKLRAEVLKAQSGKIDAVSGATYTSEGYIGSLQSAVDKARA
jgi:uncharacterized protein with FMN-binding domain